MLLENSVLQCLFSENEFALFEDMVRDVCVDFPDIQGVLITGSLTQRTRLADPVDFTPETPLQKAYAQIVCRSRRNLFPHPQSDLDIWLAIADREPANNNESVLDERGLDALQWHAENQPDEHDWIEYKSNQFGMHYKQTILYPESWLRHNPIPHYGWGFKEALVDRIGSDLGGVRKRIKHYFAKPYPREFLEVRAFPQSTFNLRPEKIEIAKGVVDRTPFPYYMKDWLDVESNCFVLYTKEDEGNLIYPFNPEGRVLGEKIAKEIKWTPRHVDHAVCYRSSGDYYD